MFQFRIFVEKLKKLKKIVEDEYPIDSSVDKKFELELCKNGPCTKLKKGNK